MLAMDARTLLAACVTEGAASLPTDGIPAVLGELKRLEAELWARLVGHASKPEPENGDQLLTPAAAADLLAVRESYVRELARRGDLPAVLMGKYVRFKPADVL